MKIETLHIWGACSTLIMRDISHFNVPSKTYPSKKDDWIAEFKKRLETDKGKDVCHDYHGCEKFSWLLISTVQGMDKEQGYLRELGFIETPPVFNYKNRTKVTLFMIPVHIIMGKLGCKNYKAPPIEKPKIRKKKEITDA